MWTPHSSLEKNNFLNHSYVNPRMGCLEYAQARSQEGVQGVVENPPFMNPSFFRKCEHPHIVFKTQTLVAIIGVVISLNYEWIQYNGL